MKFLSLIAGVISLVLFFLLARIFIQRQKPICITTSIFAVLLGTPFLFANTANAENFILPLSLLALLLFVRLPLENRPTFRQLVVIGFILGIAFMIKFTAIFDLCTIIYILIYEHPHVKDRWHQIGNVFLGFCLPFIICCLYFLMRGTFVPFFNAAYLTNIDYISYGNNFLFPFSLMILKSMVLLAGFWLLSRRKKSLRRGIYINSVWLLFSLFGVFLAQRPYTHYLLLLLPSSLLFLGLFAQKRQLLQPVMLFFYGIAIFLFIYFGANWQIVSYYTNFGSFILGNETAAQYEASFDIKLPRDYAVAQLLKSKLRSGDMVFVWGDKPQVYTLLGILPPGKLTVFYHVWFRQSFFSEEGGILRKTSPRFVVIYPGEGAIPYNMSSYHQLFTIQGITIYEKSVTHYAK